MSANALPALPDAPADEVVDALTAACRWIAPSWPLDRMIAVSPYWELRDHHAAEVTARLAALARIRSHMPDSFYGDAPTEAEEDRHWSAAARELALDAAAAAGPAELPEDGGPGHWHNVSDLLDSERDRQHKIAWRDEITQQISQFCAAAFQTDGPVATPRRAGDLYAAWLTMTRQDRGIPILMGEARLGDQFAHLPEDPQALLSEAVRELELPAEQAGLYGHALLLDINGWASWVAYLRWQDRLAGGAADLLPDLLAIRLAWDLALWRHAAATSEDDFRRFRFLWHRQLATTPELLAAHRQHQQRGWLRQRTAERRYQAKLAAALRAPAPEPIEGTPALQAVFCIDVRSEVLRRRLEAQNPAIQTFGFAGFFGLPLDAQPAGTTLARPQLPGLLAPALRARQQTEADRSRRLNRQARWTELADGPLAMFSLVESTGPLYAWRLLKNSLFPGAQRHPVNGLTRDGDWTLERDGTPLSDAERTELAATVLHALGLEKHFAPRVLLVGHGSTSRNNPHAASLDCGACGGQTGELNARMLAMLLNDGEVRRGLRERGVRIPDDTRFVAALHDTTTDVVECFEPEALTAEMQQWLTDASAGTRQERALTLGLYQASRGGSLDRALEHRARDWSQLRPEWGLAGNAAFIVAPRSRTRHVDLQGRVFLHDYDADADPDLSVLELIMTAPMVVTHWINMQYNASTTDNARYGSGNKVLHNVVGGNIGVFEGNGGDLRIGLPQQSLHDGSRWMHEPLRLSVYIAAPRNAIETIYRRHQLVRDLVDNEWLFLFRLDDATTALPLIERLHRDAWQVQS